MDSLNFPVVSFAPFLTGSESEQKSVSQQLCDAFHIYGWVYIKAFGISSSEIQQLFAMASTSQRKSKIYFHQPLEPKLKDKLVNVAVNQGYTPDGVQQGPGRRDHKKSYEYQRFNNDMCLSEIELKGFKAFMNDIYMRLYNQSNEALRALNTSPQTLFHLKCWSVENSKNRLCIFGSPYSGLSVVDAGADVAHCVHCPLISSSLKQ